MWVLGPRRSGWPFKLPWPAGVQAYSCSHKATLPRSSGLHVPSRVPGHLEPLPGASAVLLQGTQCGTWCQVIDGQREGTPGHSAVMPLTVETPLPGSPPASSF